MFSYLAVDEDCSLFSYTNRQIIIEIYLGLISALKTSACIIEHIIPK